MTWLEQAICSASEPISSDPSSVWVENNVELTSVESDLPGRVSFELFPASRFFLNRLDHPRLRKATVMKCSQSGFTQLAVFYLLRRIKERPVTTMWIGAVAEKTQEDAKKRFWPAIRSCVAVQPISPDEDDRERWTKKLIMFDTMNLMIRGSDAVTGLRGDPVGLIICDERADWKKGRIHNARQRLTTKASPIEISIGAAGDENGELHTDWKEGSQTFIHWTCAKCQHSNPFRFGREEDTLYDTPRALGGIRFDTNGDGTWDEQTVRKSARMECEKCGERYDNSQKRELLQTAHEVHRNPKALPEHYSLQVPALLLIWEERSFGDIAVEFLKACDALKVGDIEPMRVFATETEGKPWQIRNKKRAENELLDRCGDYKFGECWTHPNDPAQLEPETTLVLTFDRQEFRIVYVVRQWRKNGQSRMIWCGEVASTQDLRTFQLEKRIHNRCVWGDDGGRMTATFRQDALRYGWNVLKGEDFQSFSIAQHEGEKGYRQGWKATEFDPGYGTTSAGRFKMPAYLWSNPWFKDKLYNIFIAGRGPLWEIPKDAPSAYIKEVMANEWREKKLNNGQVEGYWHQVGPDHYADCELEQSVVADIGGLTRYLPGTRD